MSTASTPSHLPVEMSDRLGPMLVKELRQGLRTKIFLTAFIGFQAILLLMVVASFVSQGGSASGDFLNNAIWIMLVLMLIVVTPIRGQMALEKEIRSGTLELLQITRLDAWTIVRGKWVALMGEAMLYLTVSLPYFTLRYFLGGVHILTDLGLLALLALFSCSLTAMVIGLSGFRSVLLRIAVALGIATLVPFTISFIAMLRSPYGFFRTLSTTTFADWWPILLGLVIALIVAGWSLLRLGARTIATQAENHSTGVRLLTLVAMAAIVLLDRFAISPTSAFGDDFEAIFILFAMMIYIPGIFSAITDNALHSSLIYIPFIRRRLTPLGRRLLYPGWSSGIFYVALITSMLLGLRMFFEHTEEGITLTLIILNFLLLPAAVSRLLMSKRQIRLLNLSSYIITMVGISIASIVLFITEAALTRGDPTLSALFPLSALIGWDMLDDEMTLGLQFLCLLVSAAVLIPIAIQSFLFIAHRERAARKLFNNEKVAPESDPKPHPKDTGS